MFCSKCGNEIADSGDIFCKYCGYQIKKSDEDIDLNNKQRTIADLGKLIENLRNEQKSRVDIINILKNYGLSTMEAEGLIQLVDNKENLLNIEQKDLNSYMDIKKDSEHKVDWLDKLDGIKSSYSLEEIADRRFRYSAYVVYYLSIISTVFGLAILFKNNSSEVLIGKTLFLSGIFYLSFSFIFHKLRMPLMLAILLLFYAIDNILSSLYMQELNSGLILIKIVISLVLIHASIQSYRAKTNLVTNTDKILIKRLSSIIFILLCLLSLFGLAILIKNSNSEWTQKQINEIKTDAYKAFLTGYHDILKTVDVNVSNTIALEYSECFVNHTTQEFPKYSDIEVYFQNQKMIGQPNKKIKDINEICTNEALLKLLNYTK